MIPDFDIATVVEYLRPGCVWSVNANDWDQFEWLDESKAPTFAEIEKAAVEAHRELAFGFIRSQRNDLLAASDWTQAADAPVDAKVWAAYRQALRDLPANITDPTAEIKWPEPPK
jgi:hypothetical protein